MEGRKTIEKQKAAREEKLKNLLAEDKKDDGLVFDELGVDHLFIDEAHYFKNLETPTKMDRVAGIQTGGSERAFDVYMKARYLDQQHAGHGVTFATGTPISNTMVAMFTLQRFLDPAGLRSRGIEHFDAWAATFGEVVDSMEITPDGAGLRPRSRFGRGSVSSMKCVRNPKYPFRIYNRLRSASVNEGKPISPLDGNAVHAKLKPKNRDRRAIALARGRRVNSSLHIQSKML